MMTIKYNFTIMLPKLFLFFAPSLFLCCFAAKAQTTRTDLPLYHAEQQKKQATLYFLSQTLQKHEGLQSLADSIKQKMVADSLRRYTLSNRQMQAIQVENRKSYRID
jgi:hypothetical protein